MPRGYGQEPSQPNPGTSNDGKPPKKHPSRGDAGAHQVHSPPKTGEDVSHSSASTSNRGGPAPLAWVIRRQQALRRAGYNIAVDGIYGASTQSAWDAFRRGLSASAARNLRQSQAERGTPVPPGYVRYKGRIVPKKQAATLRRIDRAAQTASAISRTNDRGRHVAAMANVRRKAASVTRRNDERFNDPNLRRVLARTGRTLEDFERDVKRRDRAHAALQRRRDLEIAQGQIDSERQREIERLVGPNGQWLMMNANLLEGEAQAGRLTGHDVVLLLNEGILDLSDRDDVRTVQHAINSQLDSADRVKVDGEYGNATNAGMQRLYLSALREEFRQKIRDTQSELYDTGIAQQASLGVYGRVLKPGELLHVLSVGGPQAVVLTRELAHYRDQYASEQSIRLARAQAAAAITGDNRVRSDAEITAILRSQENITYKALADAVSVESFQYQVGIQQLRARVEARRLEQIAKDWGSPIDLRVNPDGSIVEVPGPARRGFFSDVWDAYYNGPVSPLDDVWEGVESVYNWSRDNGQRAVITAWDYVGQSMDLVTTLGFNEDRSRPTAKTPFASPFTSDFAGFKSPHQAWLDSEITLSELRSQSGFFNSGLLFDLVFDPLNFVPVAPVVKGAGLATRLAQGTVAHGIVRSAEVADHFASYSPTMARHLTHRLAQLHTFGADATEMGFRRAFRADVPPSGAASMAMELGRRTRIYKMATVTRSEGVRRAGDRVLSSMITRLRPVAYGKMAEINGDAETRAALQALDLGIPDEFFQKHGGAFTQQFESFRRAAPGLFEKIAGFNTPMMRRTAGWIDASLTFGGVRMKARIMQRARRLVTIRYRMLQDFAEAGGVERATALRKLSVKDLRAEHAAHFGEGRLADIIRDAGTWNAGGLPGDLYEHLYRELALIRERTLKEILPLFDDVIFTESQMWSGFEGITMRDGLVTLTDEASDGVRATIDDFMDDKIDEVYDEANWEDVHNPHRNIEDGSPKHYTGVEKQRYVNDEIQRRVESATEYADLKIGMGDDSRDWTRWADNRAQDIRDEVNAAWKFEKGKGWWDTRPTIKSPSIQIIHADEELAPHLEELDDLVDMFLRFDAVPRTSVLNKIDVKKVAATMDEIATGKRPVADWEQFAESSHRIEAINALYEQQALPKAYWAENLLWHGLREHQARRYRYLYYGFIGSLAVWKTATLPLRPAFLVVNVADNTFKMFANGFRDPRLFFAATADGTRSIFEMAAINPMRGLLRFLDHLYGTNVRGHFDQLLDEFWAMPDSVLDRVFASHGIEVPPSLFSTIADEETIAKKFDHEPRTPRERLTEPIGGPDARDGISFKTLDGEAHTLGGGFDPKNAGTRFETLADSSKGADLRRVIARNDFSPDDGGLIGATMKFKNLVWDVMVATPEGYQKKLLYLSKYRQVRAREIERGAKIADAEERAFIEAVETVDRVLFDYDKVTVLEENLKVFFPFIFFWRKNAAYWAQDIATKPWFYAGANKIYEQHLESNGDQPEWMRRYVSLAPVAALTDEVPGLQWLSSWLRDAHIDPLNIISISKFYRAFKDANSELPPDANGSWPFLNSLIAGFNSNGLTINPFLRTAGERFGILDYRSWQDIFPQTSLITSLTTTEFFRDLGFGPAGWNVEEWLGDRIFKDILNIGVSGEQFRLDHFNYYVQQEMAAQAARGEAPDRARAEARIRGMLAFQNIVGYSIGYFPRRITVDDRAIYEISQRAFEIYGDESLDPQAKNDLFSSFLDDQGPDLQAAYQIYRQNKDTFGTGYSPAAFDRWALGAVAAQAFFQLGTWEEREAFLAEHPEVLPHINPIIDGASPTSERIRDLALTSDTQAAIDFAYTYLDGVEASEDVRRAAENYLVTPELRAHWAKNDTPVEIRNRQVAGAYFHYISRLQRTFFALPESDTEARERYLDAHPELQYWWDRNNSASDDYQAIAFTANNTLREIYFKIVEGGDWDAADTFLRRHSFIFDYTKSEGRITPDGHWLPRSEAQRDYAAVAADLRTYYSFTDRSMAQAYLDAHPNVRRFLNKYKGVGGLQEAQEDFDKYRDLNDAYFALIGSEAKSRFLSLHPELRDYWNKYASQRSDSQHARDYKAVKAVLDTYFDLAESDRAAYLAKHPELQAYFDKYGSSSGHRSIRSAISADPEVKARYEFWMEFFSLPMNQRAAFVYKHAEEAGIFIYGSLAGNWRHDIEAEWHRMALRYGTSDRAAAYMSIKPLMDLYFSLKSDGEKALFLQTNPELQVYFEAFGDPFTANPRLNRLLTQYFRLPGFSDARSQFLIDHPELRTYFNEDATPRERAIQRLADAYFNLPFEDRDQYLKQHPELAEFFEQREREADLFGSLAAAFNETDPRMAEFREMYEDIVPKAAIHRYFLMRERVDQLVEEASRDRAGRKPQDEPQRRRQRSIS